MRGRSDDVGRPPVDGRPEPPELGRPLAGRTEEGRPEEGRDDEEDAPRDDPPRLTVPPREVGVVLAEERSDDDDRPDDGREPELAGDMGNPFDYVW